MPDTSTTTPSLPGSVPLSYEGTRRVLTRMATALAVLAAAGCGSQEDSAPRSAPMQELASPAGEGSAEPFLSTSGDTVLLSWLEPAGEGHALRLARGVAGAWSEPVTVARRDDFFVNWADFPSVAPGPGGTLWAHWLQRGPEGGYDYGVRVVSSSDGGRSWSAPLTPHEDGTPQEHGFVSLFPVDEGMGVVWLDGRRYERGPEGGPPTEEMTLRFRALSTGEEDEPVPVTREALLDARACDCCQTAAVSTSRGPLVVYRDRSPEEIRDIYATRRDGEGWTEPVPVARDGWEIGGCPVNGPAAAARGDTVAVAWFTAAGDVPRVKVAFSRDGGDTFGAPVVVDDGSPAGRVDLLLGDDGSAVVSWLERTGGDGAEIRVRRVPRSGGPGPSWSVAGSSSARASGFPRMVSLSDTALLLAWTHTEDDSPSRVRVARVDIQDTP